MDKSREGVNGRQREEILLMIAYMNDGGFLNKVQTSEGNTPHTIFPLQHSPFKYIYMHA